MVIYLDNASTSYPKCQEVLQGIEDYFYNVPASPYHGSSRYTKNAEEMVSHTRQLLAQFLGIKESDFLSFTHNATHALNILLRGFLKWGDHVIVSSFEHNATIRPLHELCETKKITYSVWTCDSMGNFDLSELKSLIVSQTRLILISHGSNVLGVLSPVEEVVKIAHKQGVLVGLDCTQTAGLHPIDVDGWRIDFVVGTGHKFLLGLPGVGFLFVRDQGLVPSLLTGGGGFNTLNLQHPLFGPHKYEAGTHNYFGIAGFQKSLEFLSKNREKLQKETMGIFSEFLARLHDVKNLTLYGTQDLLRKTPLISFNLDSYPPSYVCNWLQDRYNIIAKSGFHCAPLIHKQIGTLEKGGTVRISLGLINTVDHMDLCIQALKKLDEGKQGKKIVQAA